MLSILTTTSKASSPSVGGVGAGTRTTCLSSGLSLSSLSSSSPPPVNNQINQTSK